MTELFFELNTRDIEIRVSETRDVSPLLPFARVHEIERGGEVASPSAASEGDGGCGQHRTAGSAPFAYRFDTPDRPIAISGDTARS
jgi:hypothetical protein